MGSSNDVELKIKLKDSLSAGMKKVKSEFGGAMTMMSKSAQKESRKMRKAFEVLDFRPFKDVDRDIKRTQMAFDRLKKSGTLSAREIARAQQQLKKKTAALREETSGWGESITKARGGLIALAAAGYGFVKAFQEFSGFKQKMAEVNTLLDISKEKYAALSGEIVRMTKDIPQTATELAAAQYDIISAGVELEKSTRVLALSAQAAVAGVTDTKTAVNAGVGVVNAYGLSISELGNIYDVLFKTVKLGVTTFPELSQSMGDVLPTARAAGVGFRQVAGAIAAMTKSGIKTPQAATALKGMLNALSAPTAEAGKEFDRLGITWDGLIPTLEAIAKKGLSIDQMRKLIPDVEARTGVLSLSQNLDGLKDILGEMDTASGAMIEAYDKMKDTPENQIKLFKNEAASLMIGLGGLTAKGLLPALKATRRLKDAIAGTSPEAKALLSIMTAYGVTFAMWKLGLGSIVMGLKGMILEARAGGAALGTLRTQFMSASLAMKAGLVVSIAFTGMEVFKAVKGFTAMRDAQKQAKESQERLTESGARLMARFREFRDVKFPEKITGKTPDELEALVRGLAKSKTYWMALQNTTQEGGKKFQEADGHIRRINAGLARLRDAGAFGRVSENIAAGTAALKKFEVASSEAYEAAARAVEEYGKKLKAVETEILDLQTSRMDIVRGIRQRNMDDAEKQADLEAQAAEKLKAAKDALKAGEEDRAKKLAEQSLSIAKGLKDEDAAIAGVNKAIDFMAAGLEKEQGTLQKELRQSRESAEALKKSLEELAKARDAEVTVSLKNLKEAQSSLDAWLKKPAVKIVRIKTTEEHALGGPVGMTRGGRFPGYGGGDKINVLAEAGEFFIRKESVKKYGAGLFHALNSMRLPDMGLPSINLPRVAPQGFAFAAGGQVPNMNMRDMGRVELSAGGMAFPVMGQTDVIAALKTALQKENLVRAQ